MYTWQCCADPKFQNPVVPEPVLVDPDVPGEDGGTGPDVETVAGRQLLWDGHLYGLALGVWIVLGLLSAVAG